MIKYLLLTFILFGCNESLEDLIPIESENTSLTKTFHTKTLSIEEIPEIAEFFESKTNKGIFTAKGKELPTFDVENIIEVLDTLKNKNYSFNFTFEDTPETILYNLVIGVDSIGNKTTPIVLKYSSREEYYDQWEESGYHFSKFNGTLAQYKYTDFFESDLFSKNDCPEHLANGDNNPCFESDVTNGAIGNSGGGGASSGGSGPGASGSCEYNSYFHACGGRNQYTTHGPESCGGDGGGSYWVLEVTCPNGNNSSTLEKNSSQGDCTDCESGPSGGVAANTLNKKAYVIEEKIVSSQLNPCTSQILEDLKTLKQNDMAMIISRFGAPKAAYDWELKSAKPTIDLNNSAETDWKINIDNSVIPFKYVTNINPDYTNVATEISIARTILHEMLHTYFLSIVDDALLNNDTTLTEDDLQNIPMLWQYIGNKSFDNLSLQLQHEQMSRTFIDPIMQALKEWDGAKEKDEYYKDLAWGGLTETSTFKHFYPVGSAKSFRAATRNEAEDNNSKSGAINPKGDPCK